LRELRRERQLVAFARGDGKHDAAQAGNLQKKVPAPRIAYVTHRHQVGDQVAKIEWRAHDQKAFRPGEAGKIDAERAPHLAARAIGADEPAARMCFT
jgi:hypothetical protein